MLTTFVPYELKEVLHDDFITHYLMQNLRQTGDDVAHPNRESKNWNQIESEIFNILRMVFAAASITEDGLVDFKNSRAMYLFQ